MKECGLAEIVKSEAAVTASQPSHSSSSAPDISSTVKSLIQNGMFTLVGRTATNIRFKNTKKWLVMF